MQNMKICKDISMWGVEKKIQKIRGREEEKMKIRDGCGFVVVKRQKRKEFGKEIGRF